MQLYVTGASFDRTLGLTPGVFLTCVYCLSKLKLPSRVPLFLLLMATYHMYLTRMQCKVGDLVDHAS